MSSCSINRQTVSNGIEEYASRQMDTSQLFDKQDDLYYIKDESSNYQGVVDSINDAFGEAIVERFDRQPIFVVVSPSEELIDKYVSAEPNPKLLKISEEFDKIYNSTTILQDDEESPIVTSKADKITKNKVLNWLDTIGFTNIQTVSSLTYKGKPLIGRAYIDFAKGVMQIVEGQGDYTLTEEAMTILLQLVKQSRPELYNQMMKEIVNYKLYSEVLNAPEYKNNSLYKNDNGTLNYTKIKEEAVTKLLSEYLINQLEGTTESSKRIQQTKDWFTAFIQWIKGLFSQYKNPFAETLKEIDKDPEAFGRYVDIESDDIFLSAKPLNQVDQENVANKSIWEHIKTKADKLGIYKVGSDYYGTDGKKVPETKRVSNIKAQHYARLFGKRNFDPVQQAYYDKIAQDGTIIHEMLEDIINAYVDETTGLIRSNPKAFKTNPTGPVQPKIFDKLHKFVKGLLSQYDQGTRILTEQIVYDENTDTYGTIDFLAVLPDGRVDILDWKSTIFKELEDVKDYKKEGYFIQLNEYKRMLHSSYGVDGFRKIRAIPISQKHSAEERLQDRKLKDITIGDADASKITKEERRHRPIISPEERTGSESRDMIIEKLEGYYKKYINRGFYKDNRDLLDDITEAIYEIRTSNSVDNLADYLTDLVLKFKKSLDDNKDVNKLTSQDISEMLASIQLFRETAEDLFSTAITLTDDKDIEGKSRVKLLQVASNMNYLRIKGDEFEKKLLDKQAKGEGIFNLLLPEKVINFFQRNFRSMGSLPIASIRLMYELVKKAYNKVTIDTDKDIKTLNELKFKFDEWRKEAGISEVEAIKKLVNMEKGALHGKIDKAFYEKRSEVFASKNGNEIKKFVQENFDIAAWEADYKKKLKESIDLWNQREFEDEGERKAFIQYKVMEFKKKWNILAFPVTAFGDHNKLVWSRNILEDRWQSKEYQEIQKIPALKNLYNFFVKKNSELVETGAIEEWESYTFFPNVRKSLADIISLEDKNLVQKSGKTLYSIYDDFRKSLTVSDYELNFQGAVSETGEKLDKRFVPFVQRLNKDYDLNLKAAIKLGLFKKEDAPDGIQLFDKIGKYREASKENNERFAKELIEARDMSFDIFKVYGLMVKEIHKERYLQQNDNTLRSLHYFEQHKKNFQQNKYSILNKKGDKYAISNTEGGNFKAFEMHYKAVVLGETLQVENDYAVVPKLKEKWNKSPFAKFGKFDIDTDNYKPNAISLTKFIFWLNNANTKRILGLNAGSVISNLFGGSYSSNRLFERYTSSEDINKGWAKLSSGAFWASEEMKKNAALADYFLPLLDNRDRRKAQLLSVSESAKLLSGEWLMAPMRKTSEIVQLNIFFGVLENTGLINGRIVNLREKAAEDTAYYDRFSKSPEQRKLIEQEFKKKIKEYKEQYGLVKHAQFKTIKQAGKDTVVIDIPGVDRNSQDVENLREAIRTMSKDALGEADEFDMMGYKYSLIGRLFMTFKNWIPKTVDVRFGEFRYSQSHHAYEYGRFRMFARALSANYMNAFLRVIPYSGKLLSQESLIEKAKKVYREKLEEQLLLLQSGNATKEELAEFKKNFITEGEFVERFIKGVEATYVDFRMAFALTAFLMSGLAAPDADDDKSTKAYKLLVKRQLEKLLDEISFFYSPKSGVDLLGNSAPIISIVKDTYNLLNDTMSQFFGFTLENLGFEETGEAKQEKAKPMKRLFKVIPVFKEILTYMPALDPELAKEWGIRVTERRGF